GTVPVHDVFNWRRLWRMAVVAVGLVLGVVLVGFVSFASAAGSVNPNRFAARFVHVSGAFLERDLLLRHTPWPRRAHLELIGFDGDERRVPKDAPETDVKVRACRWVVADRAATMGWRPMSWGDLPRYLDGPVP